MNGRQFAAAALSTAIGLALGMQTAPIAAQPQIVKDNMGRMQKEHLEKCYASTPSPRMIAPKVPIPAPARPPRRAIPNPS